MKVLVDKIISLYHPMKDGVWGGLIVPTWMVHQRVRTNSLIGHDRWLTCPSHHDLSPWMHAGRIAYFVRKGWKDSIDMDVGCGDELNDMEFLIPDGNHRLSAAWFRQDKYIRVDYSGSIKLFNRLFR